MSALERAFEFMARGDMGGTRVVQSPLGTAVYDDERPLRQDSNYLRVEVEDVDAETVVTEAARLTRQTILFTDATLGERLVGSFPVGWVVGRGLVMAQNREPERAVDTSHVDELDEAALRDARREQLANVPWATPERLEQYLDAKRALGERVETRFFAIRDEGRVVSYTDLYLGDRIAQVEDVATLTEYRGRGYATAVVLRATEEARRAGCALVFLVCDAADWPQHLYRRLGFDDIGGYVKFFRP